MVLQQYYTQIKEKIESIIKDDPLINNTVRLFNDNVFKEGNSIKFPLIMFRYNDVFWNTSSEKEYKADVNFSVFIVLESLLNDDYIKSFELARKVDEAILLHPTKREILQNNGDVLAGITDVKLITNSAFKIREGQSIVEEDYWNKNNFYIWEINYKTTLIEKEYKKRYTMISNNFFVEQDITNNEEQLRIDLKRIGFDLDDYYLVEQNGKKLLVFKNVEEQILTSLTKK